MKNYLWMVVAISSVSVNVYADENPFSLEKNMQKIDQKESRFLKMIHAISTDVDREKKVTNTITVTTNKLDMQIHDKNMTKNEHAVSEDVSEKNITKIVDGEEQIEAENAYEKLKAKAESEAFEKAEAEKFEKIKEEAKRIELAKEKIKKETKEKEEVEKIEEDTEKEKQKSKEKMYQETLEKTEKEQESDNQQTDEEIYKEALEKAEKEQEAKIKEEELAAHREKEKHMIAREEEKAEEQKYKEALEQAEKEEVLKLKEESDNTKKIQIEKDLKTKKEQTRLSKINQAEIKEENANSIDEMDVDINVTREASEALKKADKAYLEAIKIIDM